MKSVNLHKIVYFLIIETRANPIIIENGKFSWTPNGPLVLDKLAMLLFIAQLFSSAYSAAPPGFRFEGGDVPYVPI